MILIVDDDKVVRLSLRLLLERNGYAVSVAADAAEAMAQVRAPALRMVITDMNFSHSTTGQDGIELLRRIRVLRPEVPVILISAWGSIPLAVEGMRLGAVDFITKPWDNAVLLQRVATALQLASGHPEEADGTFDRCGIVGESPQILDVLDTVRRIAPTDAPVLITGENGTGKELVAQALHTNSRRASAPFVKVNLGGISQSLFESEMFGSAKGAYTSSVADRPGRFEMADKGTIFLDEIGDLDPVCQVKMLRVLQEHTFERLGENRPRKVDIRVVSATNADLPAMVRDHTFREDLYYRINLIRIHLPALRERPSDIPLLVRHFASQVPGRSEISPEAMDVFRRQPYPGNIRELKNLVERVLLLAAGDTVTAADVEANLAPVIADAAPGAISQAERTLVEDAMRRCRGNVAQAAALLGVTRQTLYRRLKKYGM